MNSRSGFILIFGTRSIASGHSGRFVETQCPQCGQRAHLQERKVRHWLTFFFIPIFPVSGQKPYVQCSVCGGQFPIAIDELESQLARSDQEQSQRAISLYNSLRNSPANSITLNELLTLYGSMQEYDQAVSAAGEFPQALNASEQCMATLGRVFYEMGRPRDAIQWFDAALQRNDQLAEAHYYKALSHLAADPPEFSSAITSARFARRLNHPRAAELLAEAEAGAHQR